MTSDCFWQAQARQGCSLSLVPSRPSLEVERVVLAERAARGERLPECEWLWTKFNTRKPNSTALTILLGVERLGAELIDCSIGLTQSQTIGWF